MKKKDVKGPKSRETIQGLNDSKTVSKCVCLYFILAVGLYVDIDIDIETLFNVEYD